MIGWVRGQSSREGKKTSIRTWYRFYLQLPSHWSWRPNPNPVKHHRQRKSVPVHNDAMNGSTYCFSIKTYQCISAGYRLIPHLLVTTNCSIVCQKGRKGGTKVKYSLISVSFDEFPQFPRRPIFVDCGPTPRPWESYFGLPFILSAFSSL